MDENGSPETPLGLTPFQFEQRRTTYQMVEYPFLELTVDFPKVSIRQRTELGGDRCVFYT